MLLELAGQPAYTRLVEIVSASPPAEQEMATRGLHLGVAIDEYADEHGRGDFLIRGVVGADEDSGAVAVGEVVEVGQTVRFQVRDAARRRRGPHRAARRRGPPGARARCCSPATGAAPRCSPTPTTTSARSRPRSAPPAVAGFFAAGEIGPVGGRNHLHGFTASVLAFS